MSSRLIEIKKEKVARLLSQRSGNAPESSSSSDEDDSKTNSVKAEPGTTPVAKEKGKGKSPKSASRSSTMGSAVIGSLSRESSRADKLLDWMKPASVVVDPHGPAAGAVELALGAPVNMERLWDEMGKVGPEAEQDPGSLTAGRAAAAEGATAADVAQAAEANSAWADVWADADAEGGGSNGTTGGDGGNEADVDSDGNPQLAGEADGLRRSSRRRTAPTRFEGEDGTLEAAIKASKREALKEKKKKRLVKGITALMDDLAKESDEEEVDSDGRIRRARKRSKTIESEFTVDGETVDTSSALFETTARAQHVGLEELRALNVREGVDDDSPDSEEERRVSAAMTSRLLLQVTRTVGAEEEDVIETTGQAGMPSNVKFGSEALMDGLRARFEEEHTHPKKRKKVKPFIPELVEDPLAKASTMASMELFKESLKSWKAQNRSVSEDLKTSRQEAEHSRAVMEASTEVNSDEELLDADGNPVDDANDDSSSDLDMINAAQGGADAGIPVHVRSERFGEKNKPWKVLLQAGCDVKGVVLTAVRKALSQKMTAEEFEAVKDKLEVEFDGDKVPFGKKPADLELEAMDLLDVVVNNN